MKNPPKKNTMVIIPEKKMVKDEYSSDKKAMRETDPRPSFSIDAETLPAIKDWSVGKEYPLEVNVIMTGSRIESYGENKGKLVGEFKICGICTDNDMDEKEEEDDMKDKPFTKAMTPKKK